MNNKYLNKFDPKSSQNFGILKFYSESLSELELITFFEELERYNALILIAEIGGVNQNDKIKELALTIFEKRLNIWIKNEIDFSRSLTTSNPRLTQKKAQEIKDLFQVFSLLGFTSKSKNLLKKFIFETQIQLSGKFFGTAFKSLFSTSSLENIESFAEFLFSELELTFHRYELQSCIFYFLNELAFSKEIFGLRDDLLTKIDKYRNFILSYEVQNTWRLSSLLLIEITIKKEINLNKFEHYDHINKWLTTDFNKIEDKNIDLVKFLVKFKYEFQGIDFMSQLNSFLNDLVYNENDKHFQKIYYLNRFIHNSNLISDYLIFYLEHLTPDNLISGLEKILDKLKSITNEFYFLVGFHEFNSFSKISGEKTRKSEHGYKVKIHNESIINEASNFVNNFKNVIPNSNAKINQSQVINGFLKNGNKQSNEKIQKIDLTKPNLEYFQIQKANYSPHNKGQIFILMHYSVELEKFTRKYGISKLFCKFELWILDQATKLCQIRLKDLKAPINIFYHEYKYDFNHTLIKIQNYNDFKKLCKKYYYNLFVDVFLKNELEIKSFKEIQNFFLNDAILEGKISNRVNGGYNVEFLGGVGFLPGSLLELSNYDFSHDSGAIIGSLIKFKVISVNIENRTFIVSNKAAIKTEKATFVKDIFANLEKGLVIEGIVKKIEEYGVFVYLGGIDGLLHNNDISWGRRKSSIENLKIGQKLNVVVLDFDEDKEYITLGTKQLLPNPWDFLDIEIKIGEVITGKVVEFTEFGVFVEIINGVEGLLHSSEINFTKEQINPSDIFSIGDVIQSTVLSFNPESRELLLSTRQNKINLLKNNLRLGKLATNLNIGLSTIVNYLKENNEIIVNSPNTILNKHQIEIIIDNLTQNPHEQIYDEINQEALTKLKQKWPSRFLSK